MDRDYISCVFVVPTSRAISRTMNEFRRENLLLLLAGCCCTRGEDEDNAGADNDCDNVVVVVDDDSANETFDAFLLMLVPFRSSTDSFATSLSRASHSSSLVSFSSKSKDWMALLLQLLFRGERTTSLVLSLVLVSLVLLIVGSFIREGGKGWNLKENWERLLADGSLRFIFIFGIDAAILFVIIVVAKKRIDVCLV